MNFGTKNRPTVLIVDDSPEILKSMSELLCADYELILAKNGQMGLELAASHQPDMVLLDVLMPEMDGYEACGALKNDPLTDDIPVIFLTSMSEEADQTIALGLGAVDFLTKPVSPSILKSRLKSHLETKRKQDELRMLSLKDGLTGISNRRSFDETLAREWSRGTRNCESLSLILVDVDHFKNYNDNYGHSGGDQCLRQVAQEMKNCIHRPTDLMARYGGEEFACLLPNTDETSAAETAERMRTAVQALAIPHAFSTAAPVVTISLGLACLMPKPGLMPEELILAADRCLYQAKGAGRNRVGRLEDIPMAEGSLHVADPIEITPPLTSDADRPSILLVDDDKLMRKILAGRLDPLGAELVIVPRAAEALSLLLQSRPTLILSDAVMPGIDGFELCRRVKADPNLRDIPFVLLTSLSSNLLERSQDAGADDYLAKREDDVVFRIRIRQMLRARGSQNRSRQILVASPAAAIRSMISTQLAPIDIQVDTVATLEDVIQRLSERTFDALVVDFSFEDVQPSIQKLRVTHADIPLQALFLKGQEETLVQLESSIQDCVLKPLNAKEYRHRTELLLRMNGSLSPSRN